MHNSLRGTTQQDFHEEQSTVEITCSGLDDGTSHAPNAPFATGIYLRIKGRKFLVTNLHVVSGKHPETGEMLGVCTPRTLYIREMVPLQNGNPATHRIQLDSESGDPIWLSSSKIIEFEGRQQLIDLALIPLPYATQLHGLEFTQPPTCYIAGPVDQVIVVGFPYKRDRPIWKTAHIAESIQPSKDYFLINGRTKRGMSGSGVFTTIISMLEQSKRLKSHCLLGIYSGRYMDNADGDSLNDLDIGIVWKIDLVFSILAACRTFAPPGDRQEATKYDNRSGWLPDLSP